MIPQIEWLNIKYKLDDSRTEKQKQCTDALYACRERTNPEFWKLITGECVAVLYTWNIYMQKI